MRIKLALVKEPIIAKQAKERQAEYYGNQYESGLPDKCLEVQTEKGNASVEDKCLEGSKAKENMLAGVKVENPVQIFGQGSEEKKLSTLKQNVETVSQKSDKAVVDTKKELAKVNTRRAVVRKNLIKLDKSSA